MKKAKKQLKVVKSEKLTASDLKKVLGVVGGVDPFNAAAKQR